MPSVPSVRRMAGAVGLVCLLGAAAAPGARAQCSMCRSALEGSAEAQVLVRQINRGIVFLLAAPFSVAAAIGVAMVKSRRRFQGF